MSFAAAGLAVKDQGAALGDEVRTQIGTEQRLPQSRLQSEVELIDGLEEWKVSLTGAALQAGLRQVETSEQRLELAFGKFWDGQHGRGLGWLLGHGVLLRCICGSLYHR